jgi:hypothetical protein
VLNYVAPAHAPHVEIFNKSFNVMATAMKHGKWAWMAHSVELWALGYTEGFGGVVTALSKQCSGLKCRILPANLTVE